MAKDDEKTAADVGPVTLTEGGMPDIEVIVEDGNTIVHEDKTYEGGQRVSLPGPMAQNFLLLGHVRLP